MYLLNFKIPLGSSERDLNYKLANFVNWTKRAMGKTDIVVLVMPLMLVASIGHKS